MQMGCFQLQRRRGWPQLSKQQAPGQEEHGTEAEGILEKRSGEGRRIAKIHRTAAAAAAERSHTASKAVGLRIVADGEGLAGQG